MKLKIIFSGLVLVLAAAVGLQVFARWRCAPEPVQTPLREDVPANIEGWTVVESPIAETAEMKKAVGELLNFDDAIFRTYRRGGRQFDVYAAYWKPGKMSERLVAGHTPDVCWVGAGWGRVIATEQDVFPVSVNAEAVRGQQRIFDDPRGIRRWVIFWHMSGGEQVRYGHEGTGSPWWAVFSDLAKNGLDQKKSQYFIRISSNVSWVELSAEPGFRAVMADLNKLLK